MIVETVRAERPASKAAPSSDADAPLSEQSATTRVRPYAAEDYDTVLRIWETSGLRPFKPCEIERLRTGGGGALVAERPDDGACSSCPHVVGVLLWSHNGQTAYLWRVAVAPEQRGRGVATAILHQAEKEIRAAGFLRIGLMTREHNLPARALYAREGWTHVEDVEYWHRRLDPLPTPAEGS